jgi:transposase
MIWYSSVIKHIIKTDMLSIISAKYSLIKSHLDERGRRIWAATEASAIGRGGKKLVHDATGLTYSTIKRGMHDLNETGENLVSVRKKGGGRKKKIITDQSLKQDIERILESSTRGDPESPLLWCSKSTRNIADELNRESDRVSHSLVARLLDSMGYSLQSNRKVNEGCNHPDRDEQFKFINNKVREFHNNRQPVISVDTKKKENIGRFKNAGQEYHKKASAPQVNVYDFIDKEKGKASPYGVYDLQHNKGFVSVGISSDTAEFAVNSIRSWWLEMGQESYPEATNIYINADGGGSNGSRVRLWKIELQKLANEIGKVIEVSHFPPGTSKWNKIEHKMFCFITKNWRGKPLIDIATIINLISNTTTKSGLKIKAKFDNNIYKKGIVVSDEELARVNVEKNSFHGEWNYKIIPNN